MPGPLSGTRIVELAGMGPGPFAAMMLADMGADVIRVDRSASSAADGGWTKGIDILHRGRPCVGIDLKRPEGVQTLLRLLDRADAVIDVFRPGVAERLGFGPEVARERNPKLLYARMTGWGQDGPYAARAGHDINYVALSGTLSTFGRAGEPPLAPLNLLGDYAGGGLLMAFGIAAGLLEAQRSGRGQVIDCAMVDGAALLATVVHGLRAAGEWGPRGTNLPDSGAWFYEVYETADGKYVSFGAIEPGFYADLVRFTGLADDVDGGGPLPDQWDRSSWPGMKERLAGVIRTRTRDEWCQVFEYRTDACFAPVLEPDEAAKHPHNVWRDTFVDVDGVVQPAPAPRFDRTPGQVSPARDGDEVLLDWGLSAPEVAGLRTAGVIG